MPLLYHTTVYHHLALPVYNHTTLYSPRLSVTIKYRNQYLLDAFFFEAKGTKKKALQKRNAVSVGPAPLPASFLKKARPKTNLQKQILSKPPSNKSLLRKAATC